MLIEVDNPDWETPDDLLPGWEPFDDDERSDIEHDPVGCAYCGHPDVRDTPDPFGGKRCCDRCFNLLIGGAADDPPWRCGTAARGER